MTDPQTSQTDDRIFALLADGGRLRAILGAALDCIVAMDAGGRVLEWNPAAERTFGWSAAEALGGRFTVASAPGDGTTLRAELPCAS